MQIVTTHKNTDFDAFASTIAATVLYPDILPVLPKTVNPNVKAFLSIHKDILNVLEPQDIQIMDVNRLVVVDVNTWGRLDKMEVLKKKKELEIFLWDHHPERGDIEPTWQCHEEMGATVTLMVRQLRDEGKLITPIQATLFLAGLYEDTGNMMFPSTRAEDAYAAAYLMERRADLNVIGSLLRPAYGEKQKSILFEMLQNETRFKINGYNVSINKLNISGHVRNLSMVVHMYREILNVDAAIGIFNIMDSDRCMVIGRSHGDGLNMGTLMRSIGGGGHPGAGSAILKSVNPDAVEKMILELIEGNQQASVQISDLMSFPVVSVSPETTMHDVGLLLREKGCTGLPVVENGKLLGVISRRDFKKIRKKSQESAPVKAFMSQDIITIDPGKSPMQAARLMVRYDIGRLPVVQDGQMIGIITRSDVMMYFYDLLPD